MSKRMQLAADAGRFMAKIRGIHKQLDALEKRRVRNLFGVGLFSLWIQNYLPSRGTIGWRVYSSQKTGSRDLIVWLGILVVAISLPRQRMSQQ